MIVTVTGWGWAATLGGLGAMVLLDLFLVTRRPHEPSMREAGAWVGVYIALALLFGLLVLSLWGRDQAGAFYAGWLTEYSLSADNLIVFVIIMARFRVPREQQQRVLMIGILLALALRGAFIAVGAAAISRFSWVFYLFSLFLVYTAVKLLTQGEPDGDEFKDNPLVRLSRRVLSPTVVVLVAIGTTDVIFALDSIPAVFGLTAEPYLVFTVNVFALMGLRQLYFLIGGLLDRLVYLSLGLAVVLAFIGVKLFLEAMAMNNLPFVNGGKPVSWAPHIGIPLSLAVIVGTLALTTVASLMKSRRDAGRG
ncbi:TerC family protein [Dactylosporangium matsuzakiense]|uniref:Integral membrane protein TerC n=1 Tax=Dactylosporangium matsuzakiense TaxID=53360 RepID=A0A9W6KFF6_9ACTN|nr:integral membrane protein TerC [Dactylosporangium matsuzakiense]